MKLWDKGYKIDRLIEDFTTREDRNLDVQLAEYDVIGSFAHAEMLHSIGFLTDTEIKSIKDELHRIQETIKSGIFEIEEGIEDVHSQIEHLLVNAIGEAGKKIHLGRSRNDQVLVDLRLFFRDQLSNLQSKVLNLAELLLIRSDIHKDDFMPGYTHMQLAMVSSFGLWFGAFAESLIEDAEFAKNVQSQINKNPLGTAAGYGSSIPIDRQKTTEDLQFETLCVNSIYAQMARGKTELSLSFVIAQVSNTIGKMAMDICHFSGQNFGFMRLPKEFTTGSSIMPHKKNPDVFELIRANCNLMTTLPQQVQAVLGNLPSGYHRDFQLLKEILFPGLTKLDQILDLTAYALPHLDIIPPDMKEEKYKYLFSVENVNQLVKQGIPFRDAYRQVGESIEKGAFQPNTNLDHSHIGSIGNLGNDLLRKRLAALKS